MLHSGGVEMVWRVVGWYRGGRDDVEDGGVVGVRGMVWGWEGWCRG